MTYIYLRAGMKESRKFIDIFNFNLNEKLKTRTVTGKGKVFYGQEPHSGESTTTEGGVNYQLLAVMY